MMLPLLISPSETNQRETGIQGEHRDNQGVG
jgi:hypothetical protein